MPGVISDDGIGNFNSIIAEWLALTLVGVARLFTNNLTPTVSTVIGDLTEASFPGYAAQPINAIVAESTVAHVDTATFNVVTFTRSSGAGSVTVYGYYVTSPDGTVLLWTERFTVPIVISTVGQSILVSPTLSYNDASL